MGFAQMTQNSSSTPAAMMKGERESLMAISSVIPGLAPEVILFGDTEVLGGSWLLMNYIEMSHPEDDECMKTIARSVANLHRRSLGLMSRCGFTVPTYHGKLKQFCAWEEDWATFFSSALQESFRLERLVRGAEDAFDNMAERLAQLVVPRLLGGLEDSLSNSPFQPSLVHGDLWKLNCGVNQANSGTVLYDPCSFWGHNECLSPAVRVD